MKRLFILSLCSFVAAVSIIFTDRSIYPLEYREELRIVPKKEIVELLCLDHRGFASDILFSQVILHSGSLMWKPLKFKFDSDWSYGTIDLITDLDPKYFIAYLFSAMGLIHNFDDVKRARPIVEKGMKVFPESWELPFWIGYDHYVYFNDYEVAGEYLWKASQKPGSPKTYLSLMLSALRKKGDYERALKVMEIIIENANDDRLKMVYGKRLVQLRNLALLQKGVEIFKEYKGRFPTDLHELIKEKMLKKLPEDPTGMKYEFDSEKGRVVLNKSRN